MTCNRLTGARAVSLIAVATMITDFLAVYVFAERAQIKPRKFEEMEEIKVKRA